jgi:hypothetical protein
MLKIYQDITPPILLVEFPPEDYVTNDRVLVVSGLTDEHVEVKINDLPVEVVKGLFTMPMTLAEGLNTVVIEAEDLAKNFRRTTMLVTYDVTPPDVRMTYPLKDEAVNHSIVQVTGEVDPDVALVRVNQVPVIIREGTFEKNFKLSDGANVIVIEITDKAGNSITKNYILTLDAEPPVLELDGPVDGMYTTTGTVRVAGRTEVGAVVTVDGVEIEVTGGYFLYDAPVAETTPGESPNIVEIVAMDGVGNQAWELVRVYRDTISPNFQIYETGRFTRSDFINITGTVDDVDDVIRLTINDLPIQPNSDGYYEAFVPLEMGNNTFVLITEDAAGNTVTKEVTIERAPLIVRDEGILGLGDASWLVLVLFLMVGVSGAMAALYVIDRRKEVDA